MDIDLCSLGCIIGKAGMKGLRGNEKYEYDVYRDTFSYDFILLRIHAGII